MFKYRGKYSNLKNLKYLELFWKVREQFRLTGSSLREGLWTRYLMGNLLTIQLARDQRLEEAFCYTKLKKLLASVDPTFGNDWRLSDPLSSLCHPVLSPLKQWLNKASWLLITIRFQFVFSKIYWLENANEK